MRAKGFVRAIALAVLTTSAAAAAAPSDGRSPPATRPALRAPATSVTATAPRPPAALPKTPASPRAAAGGQQAPSTPAPTRLPLVRMSDFHRVGHYSDAQLANMTVPSGWRATRAATMTTSRLAFVSNASPDEVWTALTKPFPGKTFNSAYATFRVGFEPGSGAKLDPARWKGIQPGQRVFLDLHGVPHTPVSDMAIGVQVTHFDPIAREIHFEYTAPTPSVGEQRIRLVPVRGSDGRVRTRIEHTAEYSGQSKFVHALYPAYHEKIWSAYYKAALTPIAPLERVDHP